jgi:glutamate-1-semialdehyde 2,1-aminomutase
MILGEALQRWLACVGLDSTGSCQLAWADLWVVSGLLCLGILVACVGRRAVTALITVRALAWTPTLARRLSTWVKAYDYSDEAFFRADGASESWVERRQKGLDRLASFFQTRHARSIAWGKSIREGFSDLRFADANRVPFPFVRLMRERFNLCSVVTASDGPKLRDLDGHWTLDVSGSYGVNVAGFERYKQWIRQGWEQVKDLGPVLGPIHPLVADNIARLKAISHKDEVSFHMSGTEAVMAAVRLARFNTRRKLIVCFSGAYHGWWDGVQPGLGNERDIGDCLTLKDLHPASLQTIRWRAREIAGVLVNPVQAFHPNAPPPNDAVLLTSSMRKTEDSTSPYAQWLRQLRQVCRACDVPLIFDEVYSGFRLAPGGAQAYFGVEADLVVYGKTVAGGMPIGVVCGTKALMRRFDPAHPMRIAYVIGTFSAHPAVMGAMHEFLQWAMQPTTAGLYDKANRLCTQWVQSTNQRLTEAALPLRVVHLGTIWTVLFTEPSRYNWLLQYYLRAEGVTLSWVGTGRCLSSMDFTAEDYQDLQGKLVKAAQTMKSDGWWLTEEDNPGREKKMRLRLLLDTLGSVVRLPAPLQRFYAEIMQRKHDDHHASHSNHFNQFFHIVSSSVFICCYFLAFWDLTRAMCIGLAAFFLRQFGHAIFEPPAHDKEKLLLGYNTRNKTLIFLGYLLIPVVHLLSASSLSLATLPALIATIAEHWFVLTLAVVFGRVAYLIWKYNLRTSLIWFVKLITDPMTDIMAYSPPYVTACKALLSSRTRISTDR